MFLQYLALAFKEGMGTGMEQSLPKNLADLAALSCMPAEHASRTVRCNFVLDFIY